MASEGSTAWPTGTERVIFDDTAQTGDPTRTTRASTGMKPKRSTKKLAQRNKQLYSSTASRMLKAVKTPNEIIMVSRSARIVLVSDRLIQRKVHLQNY